MRIIIARHAKAEDGDGKPDAARELTDEGRAQADLLGRLLQATLGRVDQVWTSPLARAKATAEITARVLKVEVREESLLAPAGDLETLAWRMGKSGAASLMVVGHQPDLGVLAGRLMGQRAPVDLKKAGVCILETKDPTRPVALALATLEPRFYPEILEGRQYAPWMKKRDLVRPGPE